MIKMAVLQRGIQDEQLSQHLMLHAARLTSWDQMRNEVSVVITTRQALQGPTPMDVHAIQPHKNGKDGKGKKGKGKSKDDKGKGKGKGKSDKGKSK